MKWILMALICSVVHLKAQDWPVGTLWVYDQSDFGRPDPNNFTILQIIGDTLVGGHQAKQLLPYYWVNTGDPNKPLNPKNHEIIRYENGEVFIWNSDSMKYYLIYNFKVRQGDTVSYYAGRHFGNDEIMVMYVVESEDEVQTSINIKRRVHMQKISGDCADYHGPIIEDIGCTFYFFQNFCAVDPHFGGSLICFSNGTMNYPATEECKIPVKNDNPLNSVGIKLFPNPANEFLSISHPLDVHLVIKLSDLNGRKFDIPGIHSVYDIRSLTPGMYFLQLSSGSHNRIFKFIKM
jgi:hypothetical protein